MRRARPEDAEAVAALVHEGFEGYRAFAPAGWEPPPLADEVVRVRAALATPGTWCVLADDLLGVTGFKPPGDRTGGRAHFWLLFVTPAAWGTGLARRLHRTNLEAARGAGHRSIRLLTPAGQARARRFYEREGWRLSREAFPEPALGLDLVEYERNL